jgi:hypothetical protein
MTRTTSARIAGATFLLYIALGISVLVLLGRATAGQDVAAKLASVAANELAVRLAAVFNLFASFCALVLAVTLYGITRDEDHELAMLGLVFRAGEGVVGGVATQGSLALLWLATAAGPTAPDAGTARAVGALYIADDWSPLIAAIFFAVGSTFFSWLLLRGRAIPIPLAWLGVFASVLLVVGLPLRLAGLVGARVAWLMWMPMLLFEVPLALWLLVKGVAEPNPVAQKHFAARARVPHG